MTAARGLKGADDFHRPAMVSEAVGWLGVRPGSIVVDVTVGGGGHAGAIIEKIMPGGMFIGIDRDGDALEAASKRLCGRANVRLVKGLMGGIGGILGGIGVKSVDAILADLGVSSFQLGRASRGFSFQTDATLDMRMDQTTGESAADLLARLGEAEIEELLREFGEERFARRIARALAARRGIGTTGELAQAVAQALPAHARHGRIHPATRTFQALRIAVNDELGELGRFLDSAPRRLAARGRLVVICYHSLEDRLVKRAFRGLAVSGEFRLPARKAIRPSEAEVAANPRARSARMRVLERAQ